MRIATWNVNSITARLPRLLAWLESSGTDVLCLQEAKIAEAKTKKDMLKARAQAAQAQEQLQSAVGNLGTNSSMAAFERMEEKVQSLEARSQAAAELAGADLESQFAALEGAPEVDDELAALKGKLAGTAPAAALPAAGGAVQPVKVEEVDAELEELKRSIDKL